MDDKSNQNALYCFAAFRLILHKHNDALAAAVAEYGLSPNEIDVISLIDGVTTATSIAERLDVSKALVSRSVKMLGAKELIRVAVSERDKREQRLELTDKGREIALVIVNTDLLFAKKMMTSLDADKQSVLKLLLKRILVNLESGGE